MCNNLFEKKEAHGICLGLCLGYLDFIVSTENGPQEYIDMALLVGPKTGEQTDQNLLLDTFHDKMDTNIPM
jgi:hypothetical protein